MVATYPNLLAAGVTDLGRFDQFDLYAGESDIVTSQGQAADGQAIEQFAVLTYDEDGRLIPWAATGYYATGTITFTGVPAANDTLTIDGNVITFVDGAAGADQVQRNVGGDTATSIAQAVKALVNADPGTYGVTLSGAAGVLTVTAIVEGTDGNAITLAESASNTTVSGGTLTGGSDTAGSIPAGTAIAIAAQAVEAATPGAWLPIFTGGVFNHEALVWPAGVATLAQRMMGFAGTNIGVRQLL